MRVQDSIEGLKRLILERRKQLHERAGLAVESMFAGQLGDHVDGLAHHYSRSDS